MVDDHAVKTEPEPVSLPSPRLPVSPSPRHPLARYGLALLSGALLALCFPGPDQGWLAWIALVPLFMALQAGGSGDRAVRVGHGARLGFVTGAVFLGALLSWFGIFGWYAWVASVVANGLWLALFGALAAALLRRAPGRLRPLWLAAAWTLVEWVRSQGGLGLTWGDLSLSQHRMLPVLQMLDWTGPWGLTFLIALVNASLAVGVRGQGSGVSRWTAVRWLAGTGLVIALLTARGAWLLAQPTHAGSQASARSGAGTTLPVAVVQGNISQDSQWDEQYVQRAMEAHSRLTLEAARAGARLVIWPETSLPGELRYDPSLEAAVEGLAHSTGAELIIGSNDHTGDREYNRAFLVDPEGHVRGHYAKRHLVPYGEYVPMGAWFPFMEALHVRPVNLTPGDGYFPMHGQEHAWGTMICFESAFPAISRAMALHGAELLIEISNDTWFGRSAAAEQHAAMAPLRAIETRRALARATATGISTLVDDHGRVRRRLGLFREGYLLDRLPLRRDLTPYVRFGDWPVLLAFLICLAGLRPHSRR
jgi:apolipoprotein N-acyltransferase